jgi:hypothetical protein
MLPLSLTCPALSFSGAEFVFSHRLPLLFGTQAIQDLKDYKVFEISSPVLQIALLITCFGSLFRFDIPMPSHPSAFG